MTPSVPSRNSASIDFFFRVTDRLQLENCLHAISQDGKSVVMRCPSAALLDHYGQILVQRLRQQLPETSLEVFFPADTEALIGRFNAFLEHLSVTAATQLSEPIPPKKLWILHDASTLPEHEIKLLLRLLQHFPGGRISTVLMFKELPTALQGIDPQERRIVRWDIEQPTPAQIEQWMMQAGERGREVAAQELLSRMFPPQTSAKPDANLPPSDTVPSTAHAQPAPASAERPKFRSRFAAIRASWRRQGLVPLLLILFALSVAVALWLQPSSSTNSATRLAPPPGSAPAHEEASAVATELPEAARQGLAWLQGIEPKLFLMAHGQFPTFQQARSRIEQGQLYGAHILPHYPATATVTTPTVEFLVITGPYPTAERAQTFAQSIDPNAKIHTSADVLKLASPKSNAPAKN